MSRLSGPEPIVNYNNNKNTTKDNLKKCGEVDSPEISEIDDADIYLRNLENRLYKNIHEIISEVGSANYKAGMELVEQLAFYQICKALFMDIKWNPKLGNEVVVLDFMRSYRLTRHLKNLILTLFRRFADNGILFEVKQDKIFRVIKEPPSAKTIKMEIKNIKTKVVAYPEFAQEFSSTEYFGTHLSSVLMEKQTGLNVLFPDEKDMLKYPNAAKLLYKNSNIMRVCKVIPTIEGMTEHMNYIMMTKTRLNDQSRIKILEIGAGTGGTTIPLLKSWKLNGLLENMHYTFTDISTFFVGNTRNVILSEIPELNDGNIEFKLLDIETDPANQGFDLNSFDIIVAADVFHATAFLSDTVNHTRNLLKSGGLLVLGEVFRSKMFLEISFGLTSGWWRFGDKLRKHASPLLTPAEWNEMLKNHGFVDSFSIGDEYYGIIFAQAT